MSRQLLLTLGLALLSLFACGEQRPGSVSASQGQARVHGEESRAPKGAIPSTEGFGKLLARVVQNGRVDYALLQEDSKALDEYLQGVREAKLEQVSRSERLAFYVNAYNAWVLRLVLDIVLDQGAKGEDLATVSQVKSFFDRPLTQVAGKQLSLNQLEAHARKLGDPRVHFAVNCASVSCPELQPKPWSAETLDADLERATKAFFASKHGAQLEGGEVHVTQLLNWYASDFGGKDGARNFLLRYAPKELRDRLQADLKFLEYDWSLNRRRGR